MNIPRTYLPRRSEQGMATIIFIGLLAIMVILVAAESRSLDHLHREVKLLDQQQIKRLNDQPAATNAVAITSPTATK